VTDGPVPRPAASIPSRRSRKVFTKKQAGKFGRFAPAVIQFRAKRRMFFCSVIFVKSFLLLREKNP
jgi:hypothetical protein